jgi:glycosyltransferase involved in cell wall biosynthesis
VSVSVLILTRNEERTLPACLAALKWCDDILVFDSFSTDGTLDVARAHGARVIQHAFEDYGAQREAARVLGAYRHAWVWAIDADEIPEPDSIAEVRALTSDPNVAHAAFRMRRKDFFFGKWIRRSTLYPSWFVRLYRPDRVNYPARAVHEYPEVDGTTGALNGHLIHHSFSNGLTQWFGKHNVYSLLEAQEALRNLRAGEFRWGDCFAFGDPVRRRRALKSLSYRLPCRPALRFVYMYFWRMGFLDGRLGYTYCRMLAMYEYMIVLKMEELRRREKGLSI